MPKYCINIQWGWFDEACKLVAWLGL